MEVGGGEGGARGPAHRLLCVRRYLPSSSLGQGTLLSRLGLLAAQAGGRGCSPARGQFSIVLAPVQAGWGIPLHLAWEIHRGISQDHPIHRSPQE